jgi:hypothetical protein
LKKTTTVKTDDPANKKLKLVVTGPVEKVVDIKPASVYMDGNPGDKLEATVTITPSEKYPFSIQGMTQKMKNGIVATLIEPEGGSNIWKIKVTATSEKPNDLYDVLTLKTDSQYKPKIVIRAYAIFLKKK